LPSTTFPVVVEDCCWISTPFRVFPEMTFRAAGVVPPITMPRDVGDLRLTDLVWDRRGPLASVPIRFPVGGARGGAAPASARVTGIVIGGTTPAARNVISGTP